MNKEIELFVPGRLCLFGEHSDWAGRHRNSNNDIIEGHAIVTGIEQGIRATVKPSDKFILHSLDGETFEIEMNYDSLMKEAKTGSFYSYICGVAAYIKENYNVLGLEIDIKEITLPIKKGLSSSAAICVLVARAFNQIYNLQMNTLGEMQVAYFGENNTPSRCGRMDQACAFGKKPVSLIFDGDNIKIDKLKVGGDFYWVFADLMSKKDTKRILSDLNGCYPFAQNKISEDVQYYLGKLNKDINERAIKYFENGDSESMGKLMTEAQNGFDKYVAPASYEELSSPKLHEVLKDEVIKSLTYGGKGVGSQGDGTVQFLAKDKECQEKLISYLENTLKMDSYSLTLKQFSAIKKAIVPVAGMGSRMYPITKSIMKNFLPIMDKGMVKPAIMILLEELDEAGIEEIYLVIDKEDKPFYDKFFEGDLNESLQAKLSPEMLMYETKIHRIGKKIKYVYQEEKLGLGHAVYVCRKYIENEPFLLLLGDQFYKSNISKSCTEQVLDNYLVTGKVTLAAFSIPLETVSSYGIMSGKLDNSNQFEITSFVEKPSISYAQQFLSTLDKNNNHLYFSVFGIYVLKPEIFTILEEKVANYRQGLGEIQITDAIEELRKREGINAYIPDGKMYDIGTPKAYKNSWDNYNN